MALSTTTANEPDVVIFEDTRCEHAVLGSILIDRDAIAPAARILSPADFYHPFHGWVFSLMLDMWKLREPCDLIALMSEIDRSLASMKPDAISKLLLPTAHEAYLWETTTSVPHAMHVEWYARRVLDMADRRRMGEVLTDVASDVAALDDDVDSAIEGVTKRLREARHNRKTGNLSYVGDIDDDASQRALPRVTLGEPFGQLDRITGGFERGQMVVIAARPSVGKSAIVIQWLLQIANLSDRPVVMLSLEMARRDVVNRIVGMLAQINMHDQRTGQQTLAVGQAVKAARERLASLPFAIDDDPDTTLSGVLARARQHIESERPVVVAVDYLQLISDQRRGDNRTVEVGRISAAMKQLAREMQIPVIVLAQLNRGVELRVDAEPQLSDLRDSGAIEQDADIVLMLHRANQHGDVNLFVRKNRNGPTGMVPLRFIKELAMFTKGA